MLGYLPLLLAWLVAVVAPGPDFLAVLRTAAGRSRRAGLAVAAGVVSGITCWAVAALAGLTAVLARYEQLYVVLRLAGAVFLIGYGLTALRSAWRSPLPGSDVQPDGLAGEETEDGAPAGGGLAGAGVGAGAGNGLTVGVGGWRGWRLGLLTNLSNPKALVFFSALFAGLLPHSAGVAARVVVLATMIGMALAWFGLVVALAGVPAAARAYRRGRRVIDAVTGGLFVAVGAALVRGA